MQRAGVPLTLGNALFLLGAALECAGLQFGVHSYAVAWSMIGYGAVLLVTGYMR